MMDEQQDFPEFSFVAALADMGPLDVDDDDDRHAQTIDDLASLFPAAHGNGSLERQQSTSSTWSLGTDDLDMMAFDAFDEPWGNSAAAENVPPRSNNDPLPPPPAPSCFAPFGGHIREVPPQRAAAPAPVLVKLSRPVLIEGGPSAPLAALSVATQAPALTRPWKSQLSPEARRKHKGWAAKKRARVQYGRKFVYTNKQAVAKKRRREDGKFETREMMAARARARAGLAAV